MHGFELHSIAQRVAVWSPAHVGAVKYPGVVDKCLDKDLSKGFLDKGYRSHPPFSGTRVLAVNVVWRKGRARLTIDPTFAPLEESHGILAPNVVDVKYPYPLKYVRAAQVGRSIAIMKASYRVPVRGGGTDGASYYRVHGLQRQDQPLVVVAWDNNAFRDKRPNFGPFE